MRPWYDGGMDEHPYKAPQSVEVGPALRIAFWRRILSLMAFAIGTLAAIYSVALAGAAIYLRFVLIPSGPKEAVVWREPAIACLIAILVTAACFFVGFRLRRSAPNGDS